MFIVYEHIDHKEIRKMIKEFNKSGLLDKRITLIPKMTKNQLATAFILGIEQCHDTNKLDEVPDEVYDYYLSIVKPDKKRPSEKTQNKLEPPQDESNEEQSDNGAPSPVENDSSETDEANIVEADKSLIEKLKGAKTNLRCAVKAEKAGLARRKPKQTKTIRVARKKTKEEISRRKQKKQRSANMEQTTVEQTEESTSDVLRSASRTGFTRAKIYADIISDGKPRTKQEIVAEMNRRYRGSPKEALYWVGGYNGLMIALGKMVKRSDGMFVYSE